MKRPARRLTFGEVERATGMSRAMIYKRLADGSRFPQPAAGGLFEAAAIQKWLAAQHAKPEQETK